MRSTDDELQYFVGREDELQVLRDFVADPSPGVLLVTGPPGVGKSFLLDKFVEETRRDAELLACLRSLTAEAVPIDLAHLALDIMQSRHSVLDSDLLKGLRDGVIALFGGVKYHGMEVGQAVGKLIGRSVDMQREALQADDYHRLLAGVMRETAGAMKGDQHLVGILDADQWFQHQSLRDALDHIIAELPERAKLILGMRESDPFLEEYHILERKHERLPLGELACKAAKKLVKRHFGEDVPPDLIDGLIKRCGRLPLALDAGIKLVQQSDKNPVEALADLPGDCSATNLMRQLARAALDSERPGEDLVRVLALAREPLSLEELTPILRSSGREDDAADVNRALRSRAIIDVLERRGNGEAPYRPYHDWMREAILRLTPPPIRQPLHQALGKLYWARLEKDKQDERAIRHCTYHLAQGGLADVEAKQCFLTAVVETAGQKATWGLTRDLAEELKLARGLLEDESLAIDPVSRAVIWNQSGRLAMDTGSLPGALAHFERVRDLASELDRFSDEQGKQCLATALGNIGVVYGQTGRLEEALKAYQDTIAIHTEIGHRLGEANDLGNIGNVYLHLVPLEEALKPLQDALRIHQEIGYRLGEANQLGNIGIVYRQMGRLEEALESYQDALKIDKEIGYRLGEASALGNIGGVHFQTGRLEEALNAQQKALNIDKQIGYRLGEAQDRGNIGVVYRHMGRIEEALAALQEALEIARETGHRLGEATHLHNIGLIHGDKGEPREALEHLRQALVILEEIGATQEIEIATRAIALIEEKLGGSES